MGSNNTDINRETYIGISPLARGRLYRMSQGECPQTPPPAVTRTTLGLGQGRSIRASKHKPLFHTNAPPNGGHVKFVASTSRSRRILPFE